jgi:hypothetical protein
VCARVLIAMSALMTVKRAGIVAVVGMVVGGVAAAAGIVIAVRAARVAVAVVVVAEADVEVAVDAVIVAAVVRGAGVGRAIASVERVVGTGTEEGDREEGREGERQDALHDFWTVTVNALFGGRWT